MGKDKKGKTKGFGMGSLIGICAGIGLLAGVLFDNLVFFMLGGAAIGVVIGAVLEVRRR